MADCYSLAVPVLLVVLGACVQMFSRWNTENGEMQYFAPTAVLMVELVKLIFSYGCLKKWHPEDKLDFAITEWDTWQFAVPAAIYAVMNNLKLLVTALVDPALVTTLERVNIPISVLFMYILLQRRFFTQQYMGIMLLLMGQMMVTYKPSVGLLANVNAVDITAFLTIGALSGFASVYSEKLLKKGSNIHNSNIKLYAFGTAFNFVAVLWLIIKDQVDLSDGNQVPIMNQIFMGFGNPFLWALIIALTISGLCVAFVLRYFDTMVKCIVTGLQIVVVYGWTLAIGDGHQAFTFLIGTILVIVGFLQYAIPPEQFATKPNLLPFLSDPPSRDELEKPILAEKESAEEVRPLVGAEPAQKR